MGNKFPEGHLRASGTVMEIFEGWKTTKDNINSNLLVLYKNTEDNNFYKVVNFRKISLTSGTIFLPI